MKSLAGLVLSLISVLLIDNSNGQAQVYCGRRLADTLAYLCDNPLINTPDRAMKRTFNAIPDDYWPWIPHHQAKGLVKRQTVISECCEKPCTLNELLTYCSY